MLPTTISPTLSFAELCARIEQRLAGFERAAASPDAPSAVRSLAGELHLRDRLAPLIDQALAGLTRSELRRELPLRARRLSSGDLGVHNLLVDAADRITVLHWEWGGWDDRAIPEIGFVAHGGSEGISTQAAAAYLGAYARHAGRDETAIARIERLGRLQVIEWVTTYAAALAPETLAARRFAVAEFDADAFVAAVREKLPRRLARASAGTGYPFPH